MLIQELHDATRETLSTPVTQTLLHCLRVMRVAATICRIQTEYRCENLLFL